MRLRRALGLAALTALGASACGDGPAEDARVAVKVLRGDADPFADPGLAGRSASPVGSLSVELVNGGGRHQETLVLGGGGLPSVPFGVAPGVTMRVELFGYRASDGGLYSAGSSLPFVPVAGATVDASLFVGPVDAFTPVGEPLPGPRMGAASAALGELGAVIVGGYELTAAGAVLAEPSVVLYRLDRASVCVDATDCLVGTLPSPRREAVAVTLPDGDVILGLGRLADGGCDGSLYRVGPDGAVRALDLAGDALPGLSGAAVVVLPDGGVWLFGGDDGAGATAGIYRVDPGSAVVTRQASELRQARRLAAATLLASGQVLIVGGEDGAPLASAELFEPGVGSHDVDGGMFAQARALMRGPRVAPTATRLADDSVVVAGGGASGVDVFRLELGLFGGFVNLVEPPTELLASAPGLLRLGNRVLFVGGEPEGSVAPMAALFTPTPDQVLDSSSPDYTGSFRPLSWATASPLRARPAVVALADGSVLLAGGGSRGVTADPLATNAGAQRVELLVALPE